MLESCECNKWSATSQVWDQGSIVSVSRSASAANLDDCAHAPARLGGCKMPSRSGVSGHYQAWVRRGPGHLVNYSFSVVQVPGIGYTAKCTDVPTVRATGDTIAEAVDKCRVKLGTIP